MPSPLRVLHVIDSLGRGGAEHQLALTVRSFDSARVDSVVCHLHDDAPLADSIRSAGIDVLSVGGTGRKQQIPWLVSRLVSIVREIEPDIIHTSLFQADVVGGLAGLLCSVPVVGTICSVSGEEFGRDNIRQHDWKLRAEIALWGTTLRRTHAFWIAISDAVRANATTAFRLPPSRIRVIYRALDDFGPSPPVAKVRDALGLSPSDFVFLNAGRLVPQKGQLYLVQAMQHVAPVAPGAKLVIAGEGWLRDELQAEADRLGIASNVRLLGRRSDVPDLVRAADVFVFPSLWEGLGVALVEAAGLGTACIATGEPPMTEIVEHGVTGLCVPRRDPEALANAMLTLYRDRNLALRLGAAAAHKVSRMCSRRSVADSIEAVYRQVLASHAPRAVPTHARSPEGSR